MNRHTPLLNTSARQAGRLANRTAILLVFMAALQACGGGGGGASADTPPAVIPTPLPTPAPTPAPETPPTTNGDVTTTTPSNADTVGRARILSAVASLAVDGIPETPTAATGAVTPAAGGRNYYVDSTTGDDRNDGSTATPGAAGVGPWKTLARVMTSPLGPGDVLVLACGSTWRETLRVPASGTASQPVAVSAPAAGCATPPSIDGSVLVEPSAWTQHSGNIYKTPLATAPLQLFVASGAMAEAHHPNRGHLATDPTSPYLALAADGNVQMANNRTGSTTLTTGADLVLPAGTKLADGARLRLRTNSWVLDESRITAATAGTTGITLTLDVASSYPARAGWGYFLLGQLWMLDSAGEWAHDAASGHLYAWMPDSTAPTTSLRATVLAMGIDLTARENVVINGLLLRRVGVGIQLRRSAGVEVRNTQIVETAGIGADAAGSTHAVFVSSTFARTGGDAIRGSADGVTPASGMTVRNNLIRDSGVQMAGEQVLSLPNGSSAAVQSGSASVVVGNVIINAGYVGIRPLGNSVVEENFVFGACTVLDDCGGIYIYADEGCQIRRNTVVHSRGNAQGKPPNARYTQAQGIFLDESTTSTLVEDNTVIDTDNGIFVHVASDNTIRSNRLYGNRVSQISMYESRSRDNPNGDLFANVVQGNLIAAAAPGAVALRLQTLFASTAAFGRFDSNRYFDRASDTVARVTTMAGTIDYTLNTWQQSRDVGSTQAVDSTSFAVSRTHFAGFAVSGGNLVSNAGLQQNSAGWSHWNETPPAGNMVREACPAGMCLRYLAGGSPGMMISPHFSVVQGQWYRISIDLATEQDAQTVQLLLRRGGGGNNGYELLSSKSLTLTAGRRWARYSAVFQATKTVNARDAATGDLGARVDIRGIETGQSVSLANLELVPVQPAPLATTSGALINVGSNALNVACPFANSQPALCTTFRTLADDQPVAWPVSVPAHSAAIIYAQDPVLVDSDADGIADAQDSCPATPTGAAVNSAGCPFTPR
jgi:parallel beta-helix repeat protein